MSRPRNELRHQIPGDWDTPHPFHGFTRDNNYHDYIVQTRVCKQIIQFSRVKSAIEAAQVYDIVLWKLNPFTPSCSKPNFPDTFHSITQADVDARCPLANKWYDYAIKQIEAAGVSLKSLVEAKSQRLAVLNVDLAEGAVTEYARLMRVVHEMQKQAATLKFKLTDRRAKVGLTKFPQIVTLLNTATQDLTVLEAVSRELLEKLTDHKDLFQKIRLL